MRKAVRMAAVIAVLAIIAAACSDSGTPEASPSGVHRRGGDPSGRDAAPGAQTSDVGAAFDPQKEYYQVSFEYFRCCLLRTLLVDEAASRRRRRRRSCKPDLAAASSDASRTTA